MRTPEAKWRTGFIAFFKCAVAAALLWWLVRTGRFDLRVLTSMRPSWALAGALLFQCGMLFCIAVRWHFLTRALKLDLSFQQTLRISLIGYYAAILTPASLGLDGARLLMARRFRPQQSRQIIASVLLDRLLGLWSLLILSALCGFAAMNLGLMAQDKIAQRAVVVMAIICGILSLIIGLVLRSPQLMARLPGSAFLLKKIPSLHQPPPPAIFGWPLFLAFATHGCNLLATFCALRIFEPGASLPAISFVTPFVILSSLVPLTPLGLGVTDATSALLFSAIGIAHGAVATMLMRTLFVLLSLICGLAWMWPLKTMDAREMETAPQP